MAMETRSETVSLRQRNREAIAPRLQKQRSAVTNGRRLFVDGDARSPWSRRYYDLVSLHVSDMGGRSNLCEGQLALIKRACALQVELEQMDGRLSLGQEVDLDVYQRVTNTLRRVLESLGLNTGRKPRDITDESDTAKLNRLLDLAAEEEAAT
jgi:hypothetical protein